jgi:hypothetical protein
MHNTPTNNISSLDEIGKRGGPYCHGVDSLLRDISPLDVASVRSLLRTPLWFVSFGYPEMVSGGEEL